MASLDILDGNGIAQNLLVTVAGSDLVPHHIIESGTVTTVTGVTTVSTVTSLTQMNGQAIAMGTGVRTAGTQRVTIATDDSVPVTVASTLTVTGTGGTFPVTDSGGSLTIDAPVGTPAFVRLSDGASAITTLPVSIATAPALVASTATIGDVGLVGRTTGGLTLHSRLSTGTDSTNVKASAGQVFWGFVTNTNASARYIKFYNSASAPTLGSGTPIARMMIPPGSSGLQITAEQGLAFSTGIGYTLSTGAADSDTGTVAANEIIVNLGYR
jgi:hypothetical protein